MKKSKGFTLVELVVALCVIAVVTHIAVRELGKFRTSRLNAAANRQLEEIRDAVWSIGPDGTPQGFLADMGRLPRELEELWKMPDDAKAFHLAETADGALVATGWQGPYLRLGVGRRRLLDPWGNEFSERDSSGLKRVFKDALTHLVTNVCHYGEAAQSSDSRIDAPLIPRCGEKVSLRVNNQSDSDTIISVYWPDGFGGVTNTAKAIARNSEAVITNLPPCTATVKAVTPPLLRVVPLCRSATLLDIK